MRGLAVFGLLMTIAVVGASAIVACAAGREGFEPNANSTGFGNDAGLPWEETRDPVDCEEAKRSKSYVGCEYWPTVVPNVVWSIFDFAVVVANTGTTSANITVTGPNSVNKQVTVPAGELRKIFLPWVPELKGPDAEACGKASSRLTSSLVAEGGAYHLVSSSPIIVYQFSALQYKGEGAGGPDGAPKDWSSCPATACNVPCFSYSNDASLLLPSTAMTNNYRVSGYKGRAGDPPIQGGPSFPMSGSAPTLSVTASEPNTKVTLKLSTTASVAASQKGTTVLASGNVVELTLANAGDVAEFVSDPFASNGEANDFSGSLVQSDKPVQVITSIPCVEIPEGKPACDHIEETVLPAESLGKHYVIAQPSGPQWIRAGHVIRLYGNQDGTRLTYQPVKPPSCPDTIDAGQVVDCGVVRVGIEVTGDKEFAVSTFLLGATEYLLADRRGDPSQSNVASVEQFRTKYVFLAPNDYPVLWADITATEDAQIELDGQSLAEKWEPIGAGPYGVRRADLTKSGRDGVHTLRASKSVGVQVIGYGDNTSFQYPAGLNVNPIAPPPIK